MGQHSRHGTWHADRRLRSFHFHAGLAYSCGSGCKSAYYLAVIVLVGTVGAFTLFMKGISMVGPVKSLASGLPGASYGNGTFGFWLHTSFSVTDILGFACIPPAVLLTAWTGFLKSWGVFPTSWTGFPDSLHGFLWTPERPISVSFSLLLFPAAAPGTVPGNFS